MKIAIAGKGGTGKSTITSLIIKYLTEKDPGSVLAVDADPNSSLALLLGVNEDAGVVKIIDDIAKNPGLIPQGTSKDRFIELKVQEAVVEARGFDLLTMGRPEGPGCYCYANNVLRGLLEKLQNAYKYVVIDNEAGMEHLSRRINREMDALFIIAEPTSLSIKTAKRIYGLAEELDIKFKEIALLINKVTEDLKGLRSDVENAKIADIKEVPFDKEIVSLSQGGESILDIKDNNKAYMAVSGVCQKLLS